MKMFLDSIASATKHIIKHSDLVRYLVDRDEEEPQAIAGILRYIRFTHPFMKAEETLETAETKGKKIAVAESGTGGLVSALLTGVEGLSDHFERGFVCYTPGLAV
jgi:Uncharacterized protein (competence- and mitomycin-induced)